MKSMWGKLYGQWLCAGAVFVYDMEKFVPAELLNRIEKYKVTSFCAPPTIYRFFIKEGMEGHDFSSVKYATTAGEALNPEVFNRFYEQTGLKLMEAFGQTEMTVMTLSIVGRECKAGSMGKPSPLYNVDLVDEDGESVPPGEVGELVLRVPEGTKQNGLFMGYYKDPALTESVWHDGLYHTGDTAWRDEDGYYWYVGRTDDIIKATIVPNKLKGFEPSDALAKEIQAYVKSQTAPYKYPRIVEFVDSLPKTISGKIRRAVIRKDIED
jgi:acetyl-CoA synthetase